MTHEERMEIAGQLRDLILEQYGDAVLAVFVTSSTAKGLDLPHSDLELTAVLRDGIEVQDKSYVYSGMLIEIEYPQESRLLRDARRVTRRWPIEADGYRNRLALFERDGWLRRLDEVIAARDASDFTPALSLAATGVIELRDKLRNAVLEGDTINVRVFATFLAEDSASLVLFLNRRYMITTRWLFRQALDCPVQPPGLRVSLETLTGVIPADVDHMRESAERLTDELLALCRDHGIVVERDRLVV